MDRLASRGHTRIAAVRPSHNLNFGYLFMAGYRKALKRHGIDFDPELTAAGLINESGGYAVTPDLMRAKKPPTAIIFNNDAMALGGCRALVEMGLEPGKDVAVVVIVDTALCRYYSPPLTAFRPALEPLGRRMGEMLLAFMPAFAGPEGTKIIREIWPLELVVRDSD